MASKTFAVPFAGSGDKTAIPDATQPSGDVSYTEGFTEDYGLDQATEPLAKDIPRRETNQLYFDITELLQEIQQNGLPVYNATYDYAVGAHTIGSDGLLYRALLVNGPASTVRDPVGDVSGTWILTGTPFVPSVPFATTVFTASDPTWVPTAGVKILEVTVTGGGGGGGGAVGESLESGCGVSGSAAGTAIKTIGAPIAASYAVVVGGGGSGGAGVTGSNGGDGGDSSFVGTGTPIMTGSGGNGGLGDVDPSAVGANSGRIGEFGGAASNGDLNIGGGDSGRMLIRSGKVLQNSVSGASYWGGGGGVQSSTFETGSGAPGVAYGSGGSGALTAFATDHDGGKGGEGVVVVKEYF